MTLSRNKTTLTMGLILALSLLLALSVSLVSAQQAGPAQAPTVEINFADGAPGSAFVVTYTGLVPNAAYRVTVNGIVVGGPFNADAQGTLVFLVESSVYAQAGAYIVGLLDGPYLAQNSAPTITYAINANAPLRVAPTPPPANSAGVPDNVTPINLAATINFANGAAGSSFVVTYTGLTPNAAYRVTVNGIVVSSAFNADSLGTLTFMLITSIYAQQGEYVIGLLDGPYLSQAAPPTVTYTIDADAPLRVAPTPPPANVANVPVNVSPVQDNRTVFLPMIKFDAQP